MAKQKQYDTPFLKHIGQRLAAFRKRAGLSQEALAAKVENHRTYIGYIEQGKRDPSIGTLNKIARALGLSIEELVNPSYDLPTDENLVVQDAPDKKKK